ncbi:MAG: diaminopimelate epimerase [Minwuiales bacterium]|nr:diaminopimelate epimerase [Minwuiales bacterium]
MERFPFIKMHGLGNDFVVLDARAGDIAFDAAELRAIASRRTGIGCDQVITIEPSDKADAFMRIHNADGGEVEACGNGTRCIGMLLMAEQDRQDAVIDTSAGLLRTHLAGDGLVRVDMGVPRLEWQEIPLAREMDTLHIDLILGPKRWPVLANPVGVNIGNPHAVFFVDDAEEVDLPTVGPLLEHNELFPDRVNVSIAAVTGENQVRLRVWERGVGITRACGTAACATAVAAARRKLTGRTVTVTLDGGPLTIEWDADNRVQMTGPVATSFAGTIDPTLLNGKA